MIEHNFCGVLVTANPEFGSMIERILNAIEGVKVHARDAGHIVAIIESAQWTHTVKDLCFINGIISATPFDLNVDSELLLTGAVH